MIKISAGIAYEQNRPTGLASALNAQFGFLAKSAVKMCCTKFFFQTKLVTNHKMQLLVQNFFLSPCGFGLCSDCTIRFYGEKCLKNALYKNIFQTKVVTNQKPQLLYYVTFSISCAILEL